MGWKFPLSQVGDVNPLCRHQPAYKTSIKINQNQIKSWMFITEFKQHQSWNTIIITNQPLKPPPNHHQPTYPVTLAGQAVSLPSRWNRGESTGQHQNHGQQHLQATLLWLPQMFAPPVNWKVVPKNHRAIRRQSNISGLIYHPQKISTMIITSTTMITTTLTNSRNYQVTIINHH